MLLGNLSLSLYLATVIVLAIYTRLWLALRLWFNWLRRCFTIREHNGLDFFVIVDGYVDSRAYCILELLMDERDYYFY